MSPHRRILIHLPAVLLAIAVGPLYAAQKLPDAWNRVAGMFDAVLAQDRIVGGSIALVQDGKIVASHYFGVSDRSSGKPVDAATIFHWASNTKTLNAITVMQLRDRGLLSLDQPITRYVPELRRVHNPFGSMDAITIAMLMTHTAGFQGVTWPYKEGLAWEPFEPTAWEQLVAMMPYQQIEFAPGSRFSYSNPAWIYLAHTLEQLTDEPWQYYVQKNIFAPLGMSRSFFGATPAFLATHRSHSYGVHKDDSGKIAVDDYGAEFDPGITIPNGGWNAPLEDIARYIGFLTDATGGDPQLKQRYSGVLKRSTLEEMWQPRVATESAREHMGLGFFLTEHNGHTIVGHTGGQNGFSTFFYCDPRTGRGIIGAINTGNGAREEGARSAFMIIKEEAEKVFDASTALAGAYDVWIRNGTIVDGKGGKSYTADVLVRGDTIEYIGLAEPSRIQARQTLDATGKVVAPGFIDAHSHGDPLTDSFSNFLGQGITTVVLGQDGASPNDGKSTLAEWLKRVDEHGSDVNIATLSGHGSLREMAGVGESPLPSAAQLDHMQRILRADLAAGAFGLSFGLEYAPGRYAQLAEEKTLGDLVGRYGGVVMSHMRSEDADKIGSAIDELLQINAHVHVSHIKIVAGHQPSEARAVLDRLARSRAGGREVTADVYPYLASASDLEFLYPEWAKHRSDYEAAVRNRRPELEAHIRKRVAERNGPEAILLTGGPYAGQTVADVAKRLGKPFEKVMIDDLGYGGPSQAHFLMAAAVQDELIDADEICFSTDGAPGSSHPRSYAAFAKVLEDYVGPPPKMTLERVIYKMSGLAARIVGIPDRGALEPGKKADIVVLAPGKVKARATWVQPQLAPSGFTAILVNGALAYQDGRVIGPPHGKALRKGHTEPSA